jgi:hypothetical protein
MEQRAITAGLIGRQFIEAGETFDHAERMNWAEPVVQVKPDKKARKRDDAESVSPEEEAI